ncbi:hypothetical protein E2320_015537, partial [Naja naja]
MLPYFPILRAQHIFHGGFRKDQSTIDHCLALHPLTEKYTCSPKIFLFAVFVDFKSAFDLIPKW